MEAPTGSEVGEAASTGITIPRNNAGREIRRAVSELAGEGALPGIESASSEETCNTPGLTEPPPPPKRVGSGLTEEGISIGWHRSAGEDVAGYHVERAEITPDGGLKFVRVTEQPVDSNTYLDRTVRKGVTYLYQVRAVDSTGAEGAPSSPHGPIKFNY